MTAAVRATAVIAAAGSGDRLGADAPKALVEAGGRPLAAWSLDAFAAAERCDRIVVAAPAGHGRELARLAPADSKLTVLAGGATRSESVALALAEVESELVAIHDAARPLVTPALIDDVVARLEDHPEAAGVIAAAPITDTVKRASEARPAEREVVIAATESRDYLWAAQTPQAFRTAALREALEADPGRLAGATDEAMIVEGAGGTVLIHPAPAFNLKVTTREDLRVAELLLAQRRASK